MKPRTIICIIGSLNVGGAERHLVQVLPRLDRSRWRPMVYCLTDRGVLADRLEAEGVPVLSSPVEPPSKGASRPRRLVRIAATTIALMRLMHEMKPAIAHFFLPAAYILGAPAAFLARVPVRIMSRRSLNEYQKGHPASAWIEGRLHPTMSAILGNSRRVALQLQDEEHVSQGKIGLIYNGIDVRPYRVADGREKTRSVLGIAPDALVFIVVANLIPYKGHSDLFAAFALASKRLPVGWRLLVAGRDDGIQSALSDQAHSLGIAENVMFLGPRHDIPDLLNCADINLLSSHQEGFSNSVLEGMAAGLPSIVTDVGGNAEAVTPETGLVVPPHNPPAFAEAITILAADQAMRARMGKNARRRVEENFSIESCVTRYETLYEALLLGRRPADIEDIRMA